MVQPSDQSASGGSGGRRGDRPATPGAGDASTRARIVEGAIDAVAELGWGAVTTRAVATRAGVNNALVHYYFGTKTNLLAEAIERSLRRALAEPIAALDDARPVEALLTGTLALFDPDRPAGRDDRVLVEGLGYALHDDRAREIVRRLLADYREALADRLAQAHGDGTLPAGTDPEGLAVLLSAVIDGLLLHRLVDPGTDVRGAVRALAPLVARADERTTP